MESGKVFIKELHEEFYRLLKQKSTSFTTLREMKTCDFIISEFLSMIKARKSHPKKMWHQFNWDDEILLMDPIIRNAGLILCIETDKKNQYSIGDLNPMHDYDYYHDSTFKPTDLIFAIPNNDFSRFALAYLKTHTFVSPADILNFLIPYTNYYDYSQFDEFVCDIITGANKDMPKDTDFIQFVMYSRDILKIYLDMLYYIDLTLSPEEILIREGRHYESD
jgi:hypothetical protein